MKRVQDYIKNSEDNSIAELEGKNPLESYVLDLKSNKDIIDKVSFVNDIPSYMAYMCDFAVRLCNNDPSATSEWRVMLCESFYGSMFCEKNTKTEQNAYKANVVKIALNDDSVMGRLIMSGLIEYQNITGISEQLDSLMIYMRGNMPYAMYLPGLILLPFASYDKRAFRLSNFYIQDTDNPENDKWDYSTVVKYFTQNPNQVKYFLQYLVDLRELADGSHLSYEVLDRYINDLCNSISGASSLKVQPTANIKSIETVLQQDYAYHISLNATDAVKKLVNSSLVQDNVLCFFETGKQMDNNGIIGDTSRPTLNKYQFDYEGYNLTPVSIQGLFGEPEKKIYVVPPVTSSFFNLMMSGEVIFRHWTAAVSPDKNEIDVQFTFEISSVQFTHTVSYNADKIFIAKHMPYISMWPYVAIDWHEFFVCVLPKRLINEEDREKYKVLEDAEKIRYVEIEELEVGIPKGGTLFECNTVGIVRDDFNIIHTDKFPDAITLSYNGITFGYWIIDKSGAKRGFSTNDSKTGKIGFDFATTASVIKLIVGENVETVEGPGEYLYDIFNPKYEDTGVWEDIHNYTMLGSAAEALPKIYTYGQNNEVYCNSELIKQTKNFITGRAVIVSPGFLLYSIVGRDSISNSKILNNLKWPDDSDNRIVITEKDEARDNFILNVLSWGLLKAKLLGCDKVDVNVSYPHLQLGGSILFSIDRIKGQLEGMSGYSNIEINAFREAEANAAYLIAGFFRGFHKFELPNPKNGFMIVDIGGGTTDVAVCQYEDRDKPFAEKIVGESSFKFAGRELIDIPLLMNEHIREMWKPTTAVDINKILTQFNWEYTVNTRKPLPDSISRSISSIGFILDNTEIKNEYMLHATEKSRLVIKYKYIGLFWLLGRFLNRLEAEKKLRMPENGVFDIYLTGCASNGLQGLCAIDDDSFVDKCNEAAYRGYCSGRKNIRTRINIVSNDASKNSGIAIKEAVSLGLVLLDSDKKDNENENKTFSQIYNLEELKQSQNEVKEYVLDDRRSLDLLKDLLETLKLVNPSTYSYDSLSDKEKAFIEECLTGEDVDEFRYSRFMQNKIGESVITEDFVALYLLEVLLDMKRNIYQTTADECIERTVEGEFSTITNLNEDCMNIVCLANLPISYNVDYKIHFPEKFSILINGKYLNIDDLREIEIEYQKAIKQALDDALLKSNHSYSDIINKTINLNDFALSKLNDSVFSDAGFITERVVAEIGDLSEKDVERLRVSMRGGLKSVFEYVLERKKEACVSYGKVKRTYPKNVFVDLPFKFEDNGKIIRTIREVFPVTFEFSLDDTEHYYSYRGIDVNSEQFRTQQEKAMIDYFIARIGRMFDEKWKNGITHDQIHLTFDPQTGERKKISTNNLFPSFVELERIISFDRMPISDFTIKIPEEKIASPELLQFLENYEKELILRGAKKLVEGNETLEQLKLAINELSKISSYSNAQQLIKLYQSKIDEINRKQSVYDYAVKTATADKSIKKLTKAKTYLESIAGFKDSRALIKKYNERIDYLKRRKRKMRKRIKRLIFLALLIALGFYLRENLFICGANCTWSYDFATSVVSVSGTGDMQSTSLRDAAFFILKNTAKEIRVDEGITSVDSYAFEYFKKVETVSLPSTLESIGRRAFAGCQSLKKVNMPIKRVYVEDDGFIGCSKVNFTAQEESERNNSSSSANKIVTNQFYKGYLYDWFEVEEDWYVFEVTQEAEFQLYVYTKYLDEEEACWDISIRAAENSWSRDNAVWKTFISGNTTYTSYMKDDDDDTIWEFTLKPGKYYIDIESSNEHSEEPYYFYLRELNS